MFGYQSRLFVGKCHFCGREHHIFFAQLDNPHLQLLRLTFERVALFNHRKFPDFERRVFIIELRNPGPKLLILAAKLTTLLA
jgi:hypothetical protein